VRRVHESLRPTLAGIVLFGKPMALRRMLPIVKIDCIRVPGLEWIEDPHERFQSVEIRKPLLLALPLAEAKGTGIRSMRRLAAEGGLTLPEFHSSREADEFRVTLFLHNLLTEDDHAWLRSLTSEAQDADEVRPAGR